MIYFLVKFINKKISGTMIKYNTYIYVLKETNQLKKMVINITKLCIQKINGHKTKLNKWSLIKQIYVFNK